MINKCVIEEWKTLNKGWLAEFTYHEEETDNQYEGWGVNTKASCVWIESDPYEPTIHGESLGLSIGIHKRVGITKGKNRYNIEDYFKDWKAPTDLEKQMYNILTNYSIPWSNKNPFRFIED